MKRFKLRKHMADLMFIVFLFLMFTSFALSIVLIGAKVYQNSVNSMEENYSSRTAIAYIMQKIRQNDEAGAIKLIEVEKIPVLVLHTTVKEVNYCTYIYTYKNYLCELYIKESKQIQLGNGEKLVQVKSFSITQISKTLCRVEIESMQEKKLQIFVHTEKEIS